MSAQEVPVLSGQVASCCCAHLTVRDAPMGAALWEEQAEVLVLCASEEKEGLVVEAPPDHV